MDDFNPKHFDPQVKILMRGQFICPEEIKKQGDPHGARGVGRSDHAVAGMNLFRINVREKGRPTLKQ